MRCAVTIRLAATSLLAIGATTLPAAAQAQEHGLSQPAMPLSDALQRIGAHWNKPLDIDPDAVKGMTANAVVDARSEKDAVRQATRGLDVAVQVDTDGRIAILNDIVVVAQRDEAETNVMVRNTSTSSRLGQSLREQARNTQVISSKLLEQQQARSLQEALTNAGGVVVNTVTTLGSPTYTVRGFTSNGAVNGIASPSSSAFAAGASVPLPNIERIEVLKGPDAILLGADSLGGTVNIVTKKPSADELLYVSGDVGSFGLVRGTVDANRAISDDNRWSARIIASAGKADHNFGGYRGNEDYLFAPSLRFKNATTDAIVSATVSTQFFGMTPYDILNLTNKQLYPLPVNQPIITEDQFVRLGNTQFNAEITQKVADWLTIVARGQHLNNTVGARNYSPGARGTKAGDILFLLSGSQQKSRADNLDGYARIRFATGAVRHKILAGFNYLNTETAQNEASPSPAPVTYNILTQTPKPPLYATSFALSFTQPVTQNGWYGQYLAEFWKLHLTAGLRGNSGTTNFNIVGQPSQSYSSSKVTTNYGAVVDITDSLSVFGSVASGFTLTFVLDFNKTKLPDNRTRNAETGFKWDLFDKRVLLTASWFSLRQSTLLARDPLHRGFSIATPGQLNRGIDINLSGEPIKGLSVTAAYTRTTFKYLAPNSVIGTIIYAQPRDLYNVYASYQRPVSDTVKLGLGGGVNGNSSSSIDGFGTWYVPPSVQANLNAFASIGKLDINFGVRNLFDRINYGPTRLSLYVPYRETRNWRLTVGYRFR
ncbi:TonB-dependent siderophore receptor [Sphingomonas sp. CLY1604]